MLYNNFIIDNLIACGWLRYNNNVVQFARKSHVDRSNNMKTYSINLAQHYPWVLGGQLDCLLMDYPFDNGDEKSWKRPAVIVVPGGGYQMVSKREGEPVATAFLARGFQTFILRYLVESDGVRYPEQLLELASAVDYIKKHADEMNVNEDEIFAIGFSAGGHLVGNLSVEHQSVSQKAGVLVHCKPTAVGLIYPVISQINGHQGTYDSLLNGYSEIAKAELYKTVNLNEVVSQDTPPAFICSTAEDSGVPPCNAIRYALALNEQCIPYELHVYPHGHHGLSIGSKEINTIVPCALEKYANWVDDCASFFREFVKEPF